MTITVDNSPGFRAWVVDLETTTAHQTQARLVAFDANSPDGYAYCCLGRGCRLIGLELKGSPHSADGMEFVTENGGRFHGLPPVEFMEFIGVEGRGYGSAPRIDWPEGLVMRKCADHYDSKCADPDCSGELLAYDAADSGTQDAAQLNDASQLTFKQIADVLRYFGVKEEA